VPFYFLGKTVLTASPKAETIFCNCAGVLQYGGVSTITLPTGRGYFL